MVFQFVDGTQHLPTITETSQNYMRRVQPHTIKLHGLSCGMSRRVMLSGFPHLPFVVHVAKPGPSVECVPGKQVTLLLTLMLSLSFKRLAGPATSSEMSENLFITCYIH